MLLLNCNDLIQRHPLLQRLIRAQLTMGTGSFLLQDQIGANGRAVLLRPRGVSFVAAQREGHRESFLVAAVKVLLVESFPTVRYTVGETVLNKIANVS